MDPLDLDNFSTRELIELLRAIREIKENEKELDTPER